MENHDAGLKSRHARSIRLLYVVLVKTGSGEHVHAFRRSAKGALSHKARAERRWPENTYIVVRFDRAKGDLGEATR